MTTHQLRPLPAALAQLLTTSPDLAGAACRGQAPTFDERGGRETDEQYETRTHHARTICRSCNVLSACAKAAADLGPAATDVWARHPTTSTKRNSA